MAISLSVVLPVHNEAPILERNTLAIADHLRGSPLVDRFEIILACNGCDDESVAISTALAARDPDRIRAISLAGRGLGNAIRHGIDAAACEIVMFYAVDLPFGVSVLSESVAALGGQSKRIVIGSKGHPQSIVERSLARAMFSRVVSLMNRTLFALTVRDTQGSMLFPKSILQRYRGAMDDPGPFFQAQLVIYGTRMGCDVVEIPVTHRRDRRARATRFNLASDGLGYIRAIVREKWKLARSPRGQRIYDRAC